MKRHFQCAEQQVSLSNLTKYLRLPRKMTLQDFKENLQKQVKRHFQCGADPTMIRAWSDHENANRNPPCNRGYFSSSPRAFSIEKYNVSRPILHSNIHQVLRLPRKVTLELHQVRRLPLKVTLELHQILRLPRKVTLERHQVLHLPRKVTLDLHQILRLPRRKTHLLNHHHVWNLIYNAGSNRCHHPTSPNTAPATQNDSHAWSSSHMKHHFQCAEQQVSRSNLTKYCACHEKWHCKISKKIQKKGETSFPMRSRSEHDPTMIRAWSDHENANRNPPRKWGYFSSSPRAFSIVKHNVSRPILHSNLHQILRLLRKVTLERHQVLHLPRKVTLELHQVLHLPRKVTLELHYSSLLDSTWLYSTWLYSTWLYLTLLDTTLLDSTWLYLILLDTSWLYLILLDSSWLYSTLLALLDSTWFYLTLLDSTLLDSTWLYSTLLDSTWFYLTLVDSTWFYLTLVDSSWLYSTRPYLTLLYSTWLYLTLLDSTWLYLILLYSTLLDSTLLYLTLLDSTWL